MNNEILLAGILPESLVNGIGLRMVVFAQICKHRCEGCFNPETHSAASGQWFKLCDIIQKLQTNPLLNGVTFSGGDPFEQADKFASIAKAVRRPNFDVWCFTGYTYEAIIANRKIRLGWEDLLSNIDVLIDGPFEQENYSPNLKYRGSSNQRIIDVPQSLLQNKIVCLAIEDTIC